MSTLLFLLWLVAPTPEPVKSPPAMEASACPCGERQTLEDEIRLTRAKTDLAKSQAELVTASAAQKRAEADLCPCGTTTAADNERLKLLLDLGFKLFLALVGIWLIAKLSPLLSEFNISLFGTTIAGKLTPSPRPAPAPTGAPSEQARALAQAFESRKEPAPPPLLQRAQEDDTYRAVGIERHQIYLSHRARRVPGSANRRLTLYLDADQPEFLNKVEKVVYQLHPTFTPREVEVANRGDGFQFEVVAWGEFMLYALVYFRGNANPVQLTRYLNF